MLIRVIGASLCLGLLFSCASNPAFAADFGVDHPFKGKSRHHAEVVAPGKITRDEIKAKLNAGKPIVLVDALPEKYFAASRIADSINIPFDKARQNQDHLLPDKHAEIVVYCMNTKCHESNKVARVLSMKGYTKVKIYAEGLQDWVAHGLPLEGSDPTHPTAETHPN